VIPPAKYLAPPTSLTGGLIIAALVVLGSLVAVYLAKLLLVRLVGRRWAPAAEVADRCARPGYVLAVAAAGQGALALRVQGDPGEDEVPLGDRLLGQGAGAVDHLLVLVLIGSIAWLVVQLCLMVTRALLTGIEKEHGPGSARMRRVRTQVMMIERLITAVAVVIAVGAMLFTWPSVRVFGAGLLASAGIAGIIIGIAAQTALGNLFAGLQLAFSDALHVGDIVVVEDLWGEVEELTLTYVVVRVWDGRRLVLPVSYFTKTPFENWTRREGRIIGTVLLRLDWSAPIGELRTYLYDILREHPLWDRDTWGLQVTQVEPSGLVEVRAAMSAADGYASWDLCCEVRERLVSYLREHHPYGLPRLRTEDAGTSRRAGPAM
jgi:hypothetical protein